MLLFYNWMLHLVTLWYLRLCSTVRNPRKKSYDTGWLTTPYQGGGRSLSHISSKSRRRGSFMILLFHPSQFSSETSVLRASCLHVCEDDLPCVLCHSLWQRPHQAWWWETFHTLNNLSGAASSLWRFLRERHTWLVLKARIVMFQWDCQVERSWRRGRIQTRMYTMTLCEFVARHSRRGIVPVLI